MSSSASTVSSPVASHVDVTVQLPGERSGVFRVRQVTPFDYSACGGAFERLVSRFGRTPTIGDLAIGSLGDALECVAATAEPLDESARVTGVRGVRDPASLRRLALAFLDLNVFALEGARELGKFVKEYSERLTRTFAGAPSSTSPTSSSATATPSTPPSESLSPTSPA